MFEVAESTSKILEFLVGLFVSALTIYIALRIYPGREEQENLVNCFAVALLGKIIYTAFYIIGFPFGSLLALFVWLWILKKMFQVGWFGAAVIAMITYILNLIVGLLGIPRLL